MLTNSNCIEFIKTTPIKLGGNRKMKKVKYPHDYIAVLIFCEKCWYRESEET
jgi:hypothetical protein